MLNRFVTWLLTDVIRNPPQRELTAEEWFELARLREEQGDLLNTIYDLQPSERWWLVRRRATGWFRYWIGT